MPVGLDGPHGDRRIERINRRPTDGEWRETGLRPGGDDGDPTEREAGAAGSLPPPGARRPPPLRAIDRSASLHREERQQEDEGGERKRG